MMYNQVCNYAFNIVCINGYLWVAKLLLFINSSIIVRESTFCDACDHGHLKVAKWLLQMNPAIETSAGDNDAFCFACYHGHLDVAQWLYRIDTRTRTSICAFGSGAMVA